MVTLIGVVRPSVLRTLEATDVDFEAALTKLEDLVPAGWDLLRVSIQEQGC
jgi:hypothetical protein